ncbi:Acetyl esterase/lipase [Granulicella rosea]|uniref:Acetyl esterase/lipase n=1 Tax=Granulicella rosea TaxID=474952 RepID=A0A239IXM5_9BACT|nr:alpha/beta hydrolase [Granulicella rosea]SNS98526.1 Acetyl esterase/lipase [Granulicella rosea]
MSGSGFEVLRGALLAMTLTLAGSAEGQGPAPAPAPQPLWAGAAPGALGTEAVDIPTLTAFLPTSNPTKTAVIVAPGGGYLNLSMKKEGTDIAAWLNARGIAAFVLKYRLGPRYHNPVELQDAQRAIRTVRAHAAEYGVATDHIGMWGFSAGGHLAATAGTQFDAGKADASDAIDRQSSRPDFLVLAYPVITLEPPYMHAGSRKYLLGDDATPELAASMSAEKHVTKETPPAFLYATYDDKTVPVMNSVLFYEAMVKAGAPAEMHLYKQGPHGTGLAAGFPLLKGWPDVLAKWLAGNGWMDPAAAANVTTP